MSGSTDAAFSGHMGIPTSAATNSSDAQREAARYAVAMFSRAGERPDGTTYTEVEDYRRLVAALGLEEA